MGKEIVPVVNYYDLETGYPHVDLVERTFWERFLDWMCPSPLAAEERALMQQITRRLQLRNDIQEQRLKNKQKRREAIAGTAKVIATVKIPFINANKQKGVPVERGYVLLELNEVSIENDCTTRNIDFTGVVYKNGQVEPLKETIDRCNEFARHHDVYTNYLRPWASGAMTTEQLKRAVDSDPKLGEKIKVFV